MVYVFLIPSAIAVVLVTKLKWSDGVTLFSSFKVLDIDNTWTIIPLGGREIKFNVLLDIV